MKEVKWIIVTEENVDEVIAELKTSGQPLAIFGLSGQGYENLSTNFSAIRALVQQQQTIYIKEHICMNVDTPFPI